MLNPEITLLSEKKLVGFQRTMSFAQNHTAELWLKFMSARHEIIGKLSGDLYSVEVYPSPNFFMTFNPHTEFQKWAAIEVENADQRPAGMETLLLPSGLYAVFIYRGHAKNAATFYRQIFGEWLPVSGYSLDDRPHFALMGAAYNNNADDSEETIWIPIVSTTNSHQG